MIKKLTALIREYTGNVNIEVTKDTMLIADLGMSSFDLVQLACKVEDEFDIEIPDRAIKEFKTIGDVISFIEKQ